MELKKLKLASYHSNRVIMHGKTRPTRNFCGKGLQGLLKDGKWANLVVTKPNLDRITYNENHTIHFMGFKKKF